jgi:hypothetical protein
VRFAPAAEYAFHHPLIRAVAYESQLKSDRAQCHRRLAAALQQRDAATADENAALIAEHLEAAGEMHEAYGWHMRAGAWCTNRDLNAARASWERARRIADTLPDDDPNQLSMRIGPRTMLCATDWQGLAVEKSRGRFGELRELCSAAGDKVSLAIGMSGRGSELLYSERSGEGSQLASEQMALLESIGDPTLTMGLSFVAFAIWFNSGEFAEISRWSQTLIDLADGDPTKGAGFGLGSPLAIALAFRGVAGWWMGRPGWRRDLDDAVAMARDSDPTTFALVVAWTTGLGVFYGVLRANDSALCTAEDAARTAQGCSNDFALRGSQFTVSLALLYRDDAADRQRGLELMTECRDIWLPRGAPSLVSVAALGIAREIADRGDLDAAVAVMRETVDKLYQEDRPGWAVRCTAVLVETLLARADEGDLAEAEAAIDRLASLRAGGGSAMIDITLLQLRTRMARARGDDATYRESAERYRAMAESLGFEQHIAWAAELADGI